MLEIGNNTDKDHTAESRNAAPNILRKPRLTIRVGRHTLSFSALAAGQADNITYEPYTVRSGISMAANLREAFKEIDLLRNGWQRAMVMVDSPVLLIPFDEFNDGLKDTL